MPTSVLFPCSSYAHLIFLLAPHPGVPNLFLVSSVYVLCPDLTEGSAESAMWRPLISSCSFVVIIVASQHPVCQLNLFVIWISEVLPELACTIIVS